MWIVEVETAAPWFFSSKPTTRIKYYTFQTKEQALKAVWSFNDATKIVIRRAK